MFEKICCDCTLSGAYHLALLSLEQYGEITDCQDWGCKQKELSMTMVVTNPLVEPMISKCFIGGPKELEQYRQEMLYGILDFEVERGNWAYTYHQRYADQIPFILQELKRNPSSRRAVMTIRDKDADIGSDDPACLQHIQYFIRNGKLDCDVLFRSNDACKATFMNAFALIMLQKMIADKLGVQVGTYTHRANSFHCYEKDFNLLDGYTKRIERSIKDNDPYEVSFNYKGDWDEMMEDAKSEIVEQVEELKKLA